ncbi:MAG: sugar-binding protein, partial [Limnochordia bacterium]
MRHKVFILTLSMALIMSLGFAASASWGPYIAQSVGKGNTVTIDGDLSEWRGAAGIRLGTDQAQVVRGTDWKDAKDASATVYMRWTKDYLLLAADVTDDVGALSPGRIDNGDSVGITIDIFNGSRPDLQPFLIEMTPYPPNGDWSQAVYFRYASVWQVLSSTTIVRANKKADNSGYYLEAAIPLSDLTRDNKTLDPVADRSVFFALILT